MTQVVIGEAMPMGDIGSFLTSSGVQWVSAP